jgi:hypothetical protein
MELEGKANAALGSECYPYSSACVRKIILNLVNDKILLRLTGSLGLCTTFNFDINYTRFYY